MKQLLINDRICGGVAASAFNAEYLSSSLDEAFADSVIYEVLFDEIQTFFDFTFAGEPERPENITITHPHSDREWVITNDEGLSIWGLCCKTADWFLRLLAEEFDYNLICQ